MAVAAAQTHAAHRSVSAGILWMLVSCAFLSAVAVLGRHAALEGVPLFQIVLLRLVFAGVAFAPMIAVRGPGMARTPHLRLYAVRVVTGFVAMTTWFAALALTTVGEVQAIGFLTPLFATVGAGLILHETIGSRRWTAVLVGFAGAMVILRPGFAETSVGTWVAVASAIGMAASSLLIKQLADRDHPDSVVLITTLMQIPIALVPGLWVWQPLSPDLWAVFLGMGACGMLGHIMLARAFRAADASIVMGIDFARLPFTVLFGWLAFGELIDLWTWTGAAIIFAAAFYTAGASAGWLGSEHGKPESAACRPPGSGPQPDPIRQGSASPARARAPSRPRRAGR